MVDVNFNNDATDAAYEILVSPEGEEIHIGAHIIPLADHLENGYRNRLSFGWHRNYQRVTRGLNPINGKSSVLDAWEFRLVWNELLLLKGFENPSVWIHLAYGWGQRLGFHVEAIAMIGQLQGKNNSPKREPNSVALSKMRDGLNKDLTEQSLEASYFAFIADSLKTETNSPFGSMIE